MACLIAVLIVGSGLAVWELCAAAIGDTEAGSRRLGAVPAEQITRMLQADDLVLQELAASVSRSGVHDRRSPHESFGLPALPEALARRLVDLPHTYSFATLDDAGNYVNEARDGQMPVYSQAYRDLFAFLPDAPGDTFYISGPRISRTTEKPATYMAPRLAAPDSGFLGLEDMGNVVLTMQALRSMGIRMVLDDFGTAHSNLSYLRGFPFDGVKIDRSFLRALNSDAQTRALVEAMLTMARALDLEVVGEGVETSEQLALLAHPQCRLVQGYLLGRPQPAEVTRDLILGLLPRKRVAA